jgi:SAM-dependent methyltransferase
LEIGALHQPLRAPSSVSVRYVDRLGVRALREHYPELELHSLVEPDIIDDGEQLVTVSDRSVDFVIANHMIEHCEDPVGTLTTFLRVLRPGGVIYMAVPDCRFTFDCDRPLTSLSHLRRDHREGPAWSRRQHYEDWAAFVDGVPESQLAQRADDLQHQQYSIHYHVWTPTAFLEFLVECRSRFDLPLEVQALEPNGQEFIVIMRRSETGDLIG